MNRSQLAKLSPEALDKEIGESCQTAEDFIDEHVTCGTCGHYDKTELFRDFCSLGYSENYGPRASEARCEEHYFSDKKLEIRLDEMLARNCEADLVKYPPIGMTQEEWIARESDSKQEF